MSVAVDGAADERGEEQHVVQKGQKARGLDLVLVGLKNEVDRPERRIGNPDQEDDIRGRKGHAPQNRMLHEGILEESKNQHVEDDAGRRHGPPRSWIPEPSLRWPTTLRNHR